MRKLYLIFIAIIALATLGVALTYFQNNKKIEPITPPPQQKKQPIVLPTGSGYRFYYNKDEKTGFFYPSSWRVQELQTAVNDEPYVMIFPGSRPFSKNKNVIYLSELEGPIGRCGNQSCDITETEDFTIANKIYPTNIITASKVLPSGNSEFDYLTFDIYVSPEATTQKPLTVRAILTDRIHLEEVKPLIENIQFLDIAICKGCPQYAPTAPNWCSNGTIVQGNYSLDVEKNCYCTGHAECIDK